MESAKLFRNGASQAVRLPKDFRLPGKEVFVRRSGRILYLIPKGDVWEIVEEGIRELNGELQIPHDTSPAREVEL
ncbi:MAG: AbrB/MazE/SpoVT family DNA-binding domain-containing protein [Oscillospiraceae bacterium]|jgi:antitoxin VapB|nr:AbrB/MazE/SpoVT family DNA-binding domain-containing protein [Oscillospiraceae bacterium]